MNDQTALPRCLLQVIPSLDAGGAERACLDMAAAVRRQGGRALVATSGGRMAQELAGLGGEIVIMPAASKNPLVMLANMFRLAALIRRQKVDLVHARSRAPAWSAWAAARITGVPLVTTFHGFYGAGNALKRFYNSIMLRGEKVIAGSHFMAEHITAIYHPPPDRIAVIARGIDVQRFDPASLDPARVAAPRREWKIPEAARIILLPARLTRWKGQLLFIEALARLNHADVIGILCGDAQGRDGYEQEIRAAARHFGIEAQIRLTGNLADMPAAYGAAHSVVSASSDAEAFGRVPVEAMAMGCTIVAADHGGAAETLRPGKDGPAFGIMFPPGDVGALTRALALALAAPRGGAPEQAAAARAHVLAHYSTARMCAQTLALYRAVLARP